MLIISVQCLWTEHQLQHLGQRCNYSNVTAVGSSGAPAEQITAGSTRNSSTTQLQLLTVLCCSYQLALFRTIDETTRNSSYFLIETGVSLNYSGERFLSKLFTYGTIQKIRIPK